MNLKLTIFFLSALTMSQFGLGLTGSSSAADGIKRIEIVFRENGEGTLNCDGLGKFPCLGQPGRGYPKDLTVGPADRELNHKSREFGVDMPFAIKIWGQKGIFIHEFPDSLKDNGGVPSAGCIHLGAGNAKKVFEWIDRPTRVTISYPWKDSKH